MLARRFVALALHRWRLPHVHDVVCLLTTELVTNAVLHAGSVMGVRITCRDRAVRVEVRDSSPKVPTTQPYGVDAQTGRGLALVAAQADEWGVEELADGKVVWFEVAT